MSADDVMVQFHLRTRGGRAGDRLREHPVALPHRGVLVEDTGERRVPHVQGPQQRSAQRRLLERHIHRRSECGLPSTPTTMNAGCRPTCSGSGTTATGQGAWAVSGSNTEAEENSSRRLLR